MKILDGITQGSEQWAAHRAKSRNASEAPALMGASKYMTRNDLLKLKSTGIAEEISPEKQRLFDRGHDSEELARAIVEEMIADDLYPVVGISDDGFLSASFDGVTLNGEIGFEHKLYSADLVEAVRQKDLPAHYYWQLEQQILVGGLKKIIFVCSDGTKDNFEFMEYVAVPGRAEQLIAAWKQFDADLDAYVPQEVVATPVGRAPENLPALHIEVTGMVTASNLAQYKEHAFAVFAGINRELTTDQHFHDAEKTVKWCKDVEDRLAAAKQHALSQTATIDDLFRTIDSISAEARATRVELDKLVKARKEALREEIRQGAVNALREHYAAINAGFSMGITLPVPASFGSDVASAMKAKKTLASLRDAADTTLANAKVVSDQAAERVRKNIAILQAAIDYTFLFPDAAQLALAKEPETLELTVKARIAEHKAAEARKAEELRAKIAEEERIKAEAKAKAEQAASTPPTAQPSAPQLQTVLDAVLPPAMGMSSPSVVAMPARQSTIESSSPTLRLGQIGERLGFSLTADFLRSLGFEPAGREKSAVLFFESDFPRMCAALINHISSIQTRAAA